MMKKRLLTAAAAGLLSTGMMMNAFAAPDVSEGGGFTMAEAIQLDAPDLGCTGNSTDGFEYSNLDSGNFAITGSQKDVEFGVEVGGKQNDDRPRGSRPAACRLDWLSEKRVVRGSIGGHCGYISH